MRLSLRKCLLSRGKSVECNSEVSEVIQESGRAIGVRLIDGKIMITSPKGLWSINPGRILFTDKNTKSICKNTIHYKINFGITSEFLRIYKKDQNDSYWFTTKNEVILGKIA